MSTETVKDVEEYLSSRKSAYIDFLNELEGKLNNFKKSPEWNGVIYKVYSRAEKQPNNPLKTTWKIVEKLSNWRKDKPSTKISDIHDIIGLTIIVTFPSDVTALEKFFNVNNNVFGFILFDGQEKEEKGYKAYHFKVKSNEPIFSKILCEIQIKTILHDAWTAKTHDITYKSKGEIDDKLSNHMGILANGLTLLDEQSEIIKDLIIEKWNTDKIRKVAAKQALFLNIVSRNSDDVTKFAEEILNIATTIKVEDEKFKELFKKIIYLIESDCNIAHYSLLILFVNLFDCGLNDLAITEINEWKSSAIDKIEIYRAIELRALTNYSFGEFKSAIEDANEALIYCENNKLEDNVLNTARANCSYFIAEAHLHHPKKFGGEDKARNLIAEAMKDAPEADKPAIKDTLGAIEIAFGNSEADVNKGLEICREVRDSIDESNPSRKVAEAYFRLHERRAWRRLLEWD